MQERMRPGGRRVGWHFLPLIIAIPALYDVHRTDAVDEVVRVDLAAVDADKAARIAHRARKGDIGGRPAHLLATLTGLPRGYQYGYRRPLPILISASNRRRTSIWSGR